MLTTYQNKLLRHSPYAPQAVCPFCRQPGRLEVIHVQGKSQQRVTGCRCDYRSASNWASCPELSEVGKS